MMKGAASSLTILGTVAWGVLLMLPAAPGAAQDVGVSFSVVDPAVSLHEPVILEIAFDNQRSQPVVVNLGLGYKENVSVFVVTPDGKETARLTVPVSGFVAAGKATVDARGRYLARLILDEWYRFSTVGHYRVRIEILDAVRDMSGEPLEVASSGVVDVEVMPRDAHRLNAMGEQLAKAIETSESAAITMEAARTFRYLRDPIAVPYIVRALKKSRADDWMLLNALMEISGKEADQALAVAAAEPGERGEIARSVVLARRARVQEKGN